MKKNLTFLTGIVFLIAILIAVGCRSGENPPDSSAEKNGLAIVALDSKKPTIHLKELLINDTMHLFMYDENNSECGVIDDHLIVVKRGYTIFWKNAPGSKIDEILHIRPVGDSTFFGAVPEIDATDADTTEFFSISRGVFKLVIPDTAKLDTIIKYEIEFTVKKDPTIYIIDPYIRIPRQK